MIQYGWFIPVTVDWTNPYGLLGPPRPSLEEALFEERERARVTLDSIGDAVISTNSHGRVSYMNVVAEQMTGWLFAEARGKPFTGIFRVVDATSREPADNPAQKAIRDDCIVALAANAVLIDRNDNEVAIEDSAAPIHDRHGHVSGAVIVFHDVKFSQAMTDRMAYLARHDALTGLPNRTLLAESFSYSVAFAKRHHRKVAVLFLDLDNFKEVNDILGHEAGDALLINLSQTLSDCVRETDMVCRYGGDEFVVLLSDIECLDHPDLMGSKLRRAVSEPGLLEGYTTELALSIGVSVYPDDGIELATLVGKADRAMYAQKESCRVRHAPVMNSLIR